MISQLVLAVWTSKQTTMIQMLPFLVEFVYSTVVILSVRVTMTQKQTTMMGLVSLPLVPDVQVKKLVISTLQLQYRVETAHTLIQDMIVREIV
jgi:hypothetical protein